MKRKLNVLSQQYVAALKKHLKQGPRASLQPARVLGHRAVAIGLETLDVARIHEGALATLKAAGNRARDGGRAEIFFNEVIIPIEKTHRAALNTNARLGKLHQTLGRRAMDLATSHKSLKHGIARRKKMEKALKQSEDYSKKLLQESRQLQKHLQRLTHRILSAQEDKRRQFSHELQDEIAQTLVGINVWLLTLKQEASLNAESFHKYIARTQRLVDKSVASINRSAHNFGKRHET